MPVLLKYAYLCNAGDYVNDEWREEDAGIPPHCRENSAHAIISTSIRIVDRQDPNDVHIIEEFTPTGGNYCYDSIAFTAPANTTHIHDEAIDSDFSINVLSITYVTKDIHEGDTFYILSGEDTDLGPIGANIAIGATSLIVASPLTLAYISAGYLLKLSDGVNTNDVGAILSINKDTNTVTFKTATTHAFSASSPTKLLVSRILMGRGTPMEIGPAWEYNVGQDKIGASYLPAGKKIKIVYTNKSLTDAKRFVINFSYLY